MIGDGGHGKTPLRTGSAEEMAEDCGDNLSPDCYEDQQHIPTGPKCSDFELMLRVCDLWCRVELANRGNRLSASKREVYESLVRIPLGHIHASCRRMRRGWERRLMDAAWELGRHGIILEVP